MTVTSGNLHVVYSNRTEQLVEALAENLRDEGAFESVFDTPTILIPNWNLARFLKYELAQRFGVSGEYFSAVEEFLEQVAEEDVEFLDDTTLTSAILACLRDEQFLGSDDLDSVSDYLTGGAESVRARNVKRYQLARRLAGNFRQYARSRLDMIDGWRDSTDFYTENENYRSHERWQRRLWNRLFDESGQLLSVDGPPRYLLPEYFRQAAPADLELPESVHVFGVSHFAPVYGRIFEMMARRTELRFYVLNPCREFWEDVIYDQDEESVRDLHARREEAPAEATTELSLDPETPMDSPYALRAWGRAGRDLIHMLNTLSGYSFSERWVPPTDPAKEATLLEQVQQDVLDFNLPERNPDRWAGDESIRFLACRNKRREVEAVADQIWSLVTEDSDRSFEDVAVIVNPRKREEYQTHVEAVFEQVRKIPYNEIDFSQGERSRLMDGIEALLTLPTEPIQRENVLSVIAHPNFRASGESVDRERIQEWVDDLGIFHGGDRSDHEKTYLDGEGDLFNWDQGLRRLVLGYFMEKDGEEGRMRFDDGSGSYRPEPVSETEVDSAGTMLEGVRGLIAAARSVQGDERPLTEWFEWMGEFVREHFEPVESSEESEYHRYLDTLASLADLQVQPKSVAYEAALRFALDELGELEYRPGDYLASGVVVSSFVPQRPIPFDAVFMLGMTEEDFPASTPRSPIDLNTEHWEQGDLWDRDRERYMFFETVLSVRRRLYLSWVAEDPVTGEAIEPSSVLREFQRILEGYVGGEGVDEFVVRHHLRRYDPQYFTSEPGDPDSDAEKDGRPATGPTFNPEAIAEARAHRLRENVLERNDWPSVRELAVRDLPEPARDLLRFVDYPDADPAEGETEEDQPERLEVRALEKYFQSPLQAWARYTLGLREEDDETIIDENDEPFETDRIRGTVLPRNTYETAALRAEGTPDRDRLRRNYRDETIRLQERGTAPAGMFGDVQERKDWDLLKHWRDVVEEIAPGTLTRVRFGSSGSVQNVRTETPLTLDIPFPSGDVRSVDLLGDTEVFDPKTATVFTFSRSIKPSKFLRGYLSGILLRARGILASEEFKLVLAGEDESEVRTFSFETEERARTYLHQRTAELLSEAHDYRMPFDVCEDFLDEGGSRSGTRFEDRVREADANAYRSTRDEYGPLANVESYPILGSDASDPDRRIEDVQRERLGPFWEGYFETSWDEILEDDSS